MPFQPDFIKRFDEYQTEKSAIQSKEDWRQFRNKWFDSSNWTRRANASKGSVPLAGGISYDAVYDLEPEVYYEYRTVSSTMEKLFLAELFTNTAPHEGEEAGWARDCPYCQVLYRDLEIIECPCCGRKTIYSYVGE